MASLLTNSLIDEWQAPDILIKPLIIDVIRQPLNIVTVVLNKHDMRLLSLMVLSALLRQLNLNIPDQVLLAAILACSSDLPLSIQQIIHVFISSATSVLCAIHIAGYELFDVC